MRIKMLVNAVTRFGQRQQGEVDVPEAEAADLLARGWAIPLEEAAAAPVSTETAPAPRRKAELEAAALSGPEETAAEAAPRRKRKGS